MFMFGLKIVKEEEYSTLISHLEKAKQELNEKVGEIKKLNARIKELECSAERFDVRDEAENISTSCNTVGHVGLITDVTESALTVDKPAKRQRRTVKKTDGDIPRRKRVVQKKD